MDFYCPAQKLVIEVDGSQHFMESGTATDKIRDEYLKSLNIRVLRFNNDDVMHNLEGVFERILEVIG